jgi:hypothetical protein
VSRARKDEGFAAREVERAMRILTMMAVAVLATTAASASVLVEAESFVASYNAGGTSIYVVSCSGASGGYAVEGFDTDGEWIEMMVTIPETYGYADSMRSAGLATAESDIAMTIFGAYPGGSDLASSYHTVGLGIG